MARQVTRTVITSIVKVYHLHPCSLLITHSIKSRFGLLHLSTAQAIRNYCSHIIPKDNEFSKVEMQTECKNSCNMENRSLIHSISTILSVNAEEANRICHHILEVKELTENEIINMITTVEKAGISIPTFENNISIFIQNMEFLEHKLFCMKRLNDNIEEIFPLLNIDIKYLNMLIVDEVNIEQYKGKNKIRYLADELKCKLYMLCELMVKDPSILTLSFNRIKTVITVLKEFNYEPKEILNNLWLFKYSPRTIYRRSMTVQTAGFTKVKPWVIRSSISGLERYLSAARKETQLTTVYDSHVSLLCRRLNMPEKDVEFYIRRSPNILEIQLDKINEVLDIVLEYGYSAEDILSCHRVFLIRATRLKERLKRLRDLRGYHRLSLVYCSEKVFKEIIKTTQQMYTKQISQTNDRTLET